MAFKECYVCVCNDVETQTQTVQVLAVDLILPCNADEVCRKYT